MNPRTACASAFVTGAGGFIGHALVRRLANEGWSVRGLVRRAEAVERVAHCGGDAVVGDLAVGGAWLDAIRDGDVLFHSAARVQLSGPRPDFHRDTVETTKTLLAAARLRRVRRFVHVSSIAVYSLPVAGTPCAADRSETRPPGYNEYARAKLTAERIVREECERSGREWTIARLAYVYGPGQMALLDTFVPHARRDRVFVIGDGSNRLPATYLDDAVRALVLAGEHPRAAGRVYDVAGDEPVTQRQWLDALADAFGIPRTRRRVRPRVAYALVWVAEQFARITDGEPRVTRVLLDLLSRDVVVDCSAIRRELGWRPEVRFEDGMARLGQWIAQHVHRTASSAPAEAVRRAPA